MHRRPSSLLHWGVGDRRSRHWTGTCPPSCYAATGFLAILHVGERGGFGGGGFFGGRRVNAQQHPGCDAQDPRVPSVSTTVYPALQEGIPPSVLAPKPSHGIIMEDVFAEIPRLLGLMVEHNAPVLVYGSNLSVEAMARMLSKDRPSLIATELKVFIRPTVMRPSDRMAYEVRSATIVAKPDLVRTMLPNYLSVEASHMVCKDNPPLSVLDFFVHLCCRKVDVTIVALFCASPATATHWSMVSINPVNADVGLPCDQLNTSNWGTAIAAASKDPLPIMLDEEYRTRVQWLLADDVPNWSLFEEMQLRQTWDRRDWERAAVKAKAEARAKEKAASSHHPLVLQSLK